MSAHSVETTLAGHTLTDDLEIKAYRAALAVRSQGKIQAIKAAREATRSDSLVGLCAYDLRTAKEFVERHFPEFALRSNQFPNLPATPAPTFRDVDPRGIQIGRMATKTDFVDIARALGMDRVNDSFPVHALRQLIRARLVQLHGQGKI